ncbi:MAG: phosphoglycerate dehydrogenase [Deferrisomatales bacterium]
MKRVLVSDPLSPRGIEILQGPPELQVDVRPGLPPGELKRVVGGYDALVVRSGTRVTADVIEAATALKVIGRAGIGVDNVDVAAATQRGIVVMNTPGGNAVTTAEHALALLVSLVRHIPQATRSMKQGRWEKKAFPGRELRGKTLGVLGLGNIGRIVADRARGFKMRVVAHDPYVSADRAAELGVELVDFEELLGRSDLLTVHVPLVEATRNLLDADAFERMKPGAYLVCAARGGIVDEEALLQALESGRIAGAALDVFAQEPPGPTPLVTHPRVVCTPHLGASTVEAQEAVAVEVAGQIVDYLVWGTIRNAVNAPSLPAEALERVRPYLALARSLGRLQAQLGVPGLQAVELAYSAKIPPRKIPLLTASVLEGLLGASLGDRVNVVNAPLLARQRGIHVKEIAAGAGEGYAAAIRLRVETDQGRFSVAGAVFGQRDPRVVEIDGHDLEAIPSGYLLVFWNHDRPGVVARVGQTLGRRNINIAQMQLGRKVPGDRAVAVVNVDSPVGPEVLEEIRRLPGMIHATTAHL